MKQIMLAQSQNNFNQILFRFFDGGGIKFYTILFLLLVSSYYSKAQRIDLTSDVRDVEVIEEEQTAPQTLCQRYSQGWSDLKAIGDAGDIWTFPNGSQSKVTTALQFLSIMNSTSAIINLNVKINGRFTIDVPLIFSNCKVKMGEGASIHVNARFRSNASKFFACQGMWDGIYIKTGGSIVLENTTEIEDALYAVDITDESTYTSITRTIFNRNNVGIVFRKQNTSNINLNAFFKNKFDCTSIMNNGNWPVCGIETFNVNIPTLGWAPAASKVRSYANIFTGSITKGIIANRSTLVIQLCRFINILSTNKGGMAIDATTSNITFKGFGIPNVTNSNFSPNPDDADFYNCRKGAIRAMRTSLNISQTYFEFSHSPSADLIQVANVIESFNNSDAELIEISDNYFNLFLPISKGIKVSRSENICRVNRNTFTFVNLGSSTIEPLINCIVVSAGSSVSKPCYITQNKIYCYQILMFLKGITLEQGKTYFVNNNIIDKMPSNNTYPSIGIDVVRCQRPSNISFNEITGYANPVGGPGISSASVGIKVLNTSLAANNAPVQQKFRFCGNKIKWCDNGLLFLGNNDNSLLADNEFRENRTHLRLRKEGTGDPRISKQFSNTSFRKNIYIGAAQNQGGGGELAVMESGNPFLSQFKVDSRLSEACGTNLLCSKVAFESIKVPTGFAKTDWFADNGNNDTGCEETQSSVAWEEIDEAILTEAFDAEHEVTLWEAQRYLYQKLSDNPSLLSDAPDRQAFYDAFAESNMPAFNELQQNLSHLFEIEDATLLDLRVTEAESIVQWSDLAHTANESEEWSVEDLSLFETYSNNLTSVQESLAQAILNYTNGISAKITQYINENAAINTATGYEADAKLANHLWLRHIETQGNLDENEQQQVETLAAKCFYVAGTAKYQAMSILPYYDAAQYWGMGCENGERVIKQTESSPTLLLFPNPAQDLLYYDAKNIEQLQVFDLSGKELLKVNTPNTNQIELGTWQNGLYLLKATFNNGAVIAKKFTIIH